MYLKNVNTWAIQMYIIYNTSQYILSTLLSWARNKCNKTTSSWRVRSNSLLTKDKCTSSGVIPKNHDSTGPYDPSFKCSSREFTRTRNCSYVTPVSTVYLRIHAHMSLFLCLCLRVVPEKSDHNTVPAATKRDNLDMVSVEKFCT